MLYEVITTETTTFEVGGLTRTTENCAVPPASVVISPDVGVTMNPVTSLSVLTIV